MSSWDKSVRLYDCSTNTLVHNHNCGAPVLDVAFCDGLTAVSGGIGQKVQYFDYTASEEKSTTLGHHDLPVRCVEYSKAINCAISGSWDTTVRLFDIRASGCQNKVYAADKVYAMSVGGDWRVTVGSTKVEVFDARKMDTPLESSAPPLKHQIRCIATFPDNKGYVISSVEGRCSGSYLSTHRVFFRNDVFFFSSAAVCRPS